MTISTKDCVKVGVTAALVYLFVHFCDNIFGMCGLLLSSAMPLITGFIIAYVVGILMQFYEKKLPFEKLKNGDKWEPPLCLTLAFVTFALIIYLGFKMVLPELLRCITLLVSEIPPAIERLVDWLQHNDVLEHSLIKEAVDSLATVDWKEKIMQMVQVLFQGFGGAAQVAVTTVLSLFGGVTNAVIAVIFALYLLGSKKKLSAQIERAAQKYLGADKCQKISYVLVTANSCFHKFIVGQCVEAVILGVLCILGMSLFQFPYAMMVGTVIGFTALIPIAGGYIGAAVGAFMIMTVDPGKVLPFILFILILQQLEGNLIYPKVVGNSVGLPGVWVLAAVTIGGGLYGIPGMLIGVPLAATAYALIKADIRGKTPEYMQRQKKKESALITDNRKINQ